MNHRGWFYQLQGAHGLLGSERERPASAAPLAVRRLGGLLTGQPQPSKIWVASEVHFATCRPPRKGRD
jgi:hypothetical protein